MSKLERRPFLEYGLPWRAMFRKHFWQRTFNGARLLVTHDRFAQVGRCRFFRGRGDAWVNFGQIRLVLVRRLPVARFREEIRIPRLLTGHADTEWASGRRPSCCRPSLARLPRAAEDRGPGSGNTGTYQPPRMHLQ